MLDETEAEAVREGTYDLDDVLAEVDTSSTPLCAT
jgi:hypothetical protein